ncbi:MAG TPA: 1-(5-phosphoribosyl)-5-[(5-phosphoribosylamino)methylideneamino]imidazole-4-carboxamide isomerase [Bacteroidetes bacterium]|nr:1-(5-phosphoribosyl)-5-[(5-phosphoribosylamino)methylideneamino]imidazole-4-carboxamide isomerase [Bacteroidota bacterium]
MIRLIPAIDIMEGRCVRLEKGDFGRQTNYTVDMPELAVQYEQAGFTRLHLVDLDGARAGVVKNLNVLGKICSVTGLVVDFGGGVQSEADLEQVFHAGAAMVTVGSLAVKNRNLLQQWLLRYGPSRFILGADVRNRRILISGWTGEAGTGLFEFLEYWISQGVEQVLCTDIEKDGMLTGPSVELYQEIMDRFPGIRLIASGGISSVEDIKRLNESGISGVVLGKALLEGKIKPDELEPFLKNNQTN